VQVQYSPRSTIRNSYFFLTQNSVSQSYGFECYSGSDNLVENNVFQGIASPLMINGNCSGAVVDYNFTINNYYSASSGYNLAGNNDHTAGIDNVLFEGNYGDQAYSDVFHGTHHFLTYFRNRWTGPQPACWLGGSTYVSSSFGACNNNLSPIVLLSFSRFFNLVGNVLGTSGVNTGYTSGEFPIYAFGGGNSEGSVTVGTDPNVGTTVMLWGNYDTSNGAARFVSSEVPSSLSGAQAPYANPVPGSESLPPSFSYSSQPSWWPSGKAWPPIGPDVSGGNISGVGGHAYTIPAQDCFTNVMGGSANGTGAVLSFNENDCYSAGGSANPPPAQPAPPTGLSVTVS
jgi:hypothetical protein